jgi:predicted tellurium resistance membrane protein TerC
VAQNPVQSATALPTAPDADRKKRMRAYSTAMSIRMACLILVFFVPGWWKVVFGVGAVVLPYVAVVLANAGSTLGTIAINPGPAGVRAIEQPQRPE